MPDSCSVCVIENEVFMTVSQQQFDFSKSRVLVIGDLMLDRYWYGDTGRISPEAPVPVVKVNHIEERPGGAGNVALNIAALGAQVILMGVIGQDDAGDRLISRLDAANIDHRLQRVDVLPTVVKLRVLSAHQQLIRLDFEEDLSQAVNSAELLAVYKDALNNVDAVILSDYAKGTLKPCTPFIEAARQANIPVFIDPKNKSFERYCGVAVLTPNMKEFEAVTGECQHESDIVEHAVALCKACDLQAILLTRGAQGMTLITREGLEKHMPARAKEIFDVTGAGDTVIATFVVAVSSGASFEEAMVYANTAAGIVVGKMGAATVSTPELRAQLLLTHGLTTRGVLTQEQLVFAVEAARAQGERVVMTNGCFDILHAGHVYYLETAKSRGDRLIVAVNDDASVAALKGENRPLNPLARRMSVLAGLNAVDWVVSFSETTPRHLLEIIKPDILAKGGDYGVDEVVGADIVKAYGGEIVVLDFVEDLSTTAMIDKIHSQTQE
jgi:D-beta-D-heptose 7-phosphate kinase / D-beta-D-heptose 1-phosphate adenosyltransferase